MSKKLKRAIQGIALLAVMLLGYFGYQMYKYSAGVVEDTKRLKEFKRPDEIKLTDTTSMVIKKDSLLRENQ